MLLFGPARNQPQSALTWSGSDLGSPWSAPAQLTTFGVVPLADVGSGTYQATVTYSVIGPPASPPSLSFIVAPPTHTVATNWLTLSHPTDAALLKVSSSPLNIPGAQTTNAALGTGSSAAGGTRQVVEFVSGRAGVLCLQMHVGGDDTVSIGHLRLMKVPPTLTP